MCVSTGRKMDWKVAVEVDVEVDDGSEGKGEERSVS